MTFTLKTDMKDWRKQLEKEVAKAIADGVSRLVIQTERTAQKPEINEDRKTSCFDFLKFRPVSLSRNNQDPVAYARTHLGDCSPFSREPYSQDSVSDPTK